MMRYLYPTTLALCFGACALLAASSVVGNARKAADSKNWGLASFACLGTGYAGLALLSEFAHGAALAETFQVVLSGLLPGLAYFFGQTLLEPAQTRGVGVRLQRAHRAVAACITLGVMADVLFDTQFVLRGVSSASGSSAALLHWTWPASLYLVWAAGVLGCLVGAGLRVARPQAWLALVLYLSLLHDFAYWTGLGGVGVLQPIGVLAYLIGMEHQTQLRHRLAVSGFEQTLLRLTSERKRLLLSSGLLQKQRLDSLGALSSVIAHEINNPIQGIMNYASLLRMSAKHQPALLVYLDKIDAESDRVANIAKGILRFGRVDETLETQSSFEEVLRATLALTRSAMRKESISLQLQVASDLPPLRCPPDQLQQVLVNLITNALDALSTRCAQRPEEKTLKITVELEERAGQPFVRCSIEDNGDGMSQEAASRMFEPFFTTGEARGCAGLGLPLSQAIVESHGGMLRLAETTSEGTRLELLLPCAPAQARPELERASA